MWTLVEERRFISNCSISKLGDYATYKYSQLFMRYKALVRKIAYRVASTDSVHGSSP